MASILNSWVKGDWMRLSRHRDDLLAAPNLLLQGIQLLNNRAIVIHYEELVSDPASRVAQLCSRLGLDFFPDMLEYGERPAPLGRYGDQTGIDKHVRPTAESLDHWLELGRSTQMRRFAQMYLRALGPELLAGLGYDPVELDAKLRAVHCSQRGMSVSWKQVFTPEKTFRDKLVLITMEFLQQRNLPQYAGRLARLLMGRL
jgi:hypothetical protein